MQERRPLKRAVRILVECILVDYKVNYYNKKAIHFVGYGRTNAMCSNDKVAVTINKEHGYYGSVLIAAHELGHK